MSKDSLRLYSILDKKVELYGTPICFRTDAECMRAVVDALSDPNHMYFKYSDDYAVYFIGMFDDSTCDYVKAEPIQKLTEVSSLVSLAVRGRKELNNECAK